MVTMTYTGKRRTIRRGPRTYALKRGTFKVHPEDVDTLLALGARVKADADVQPDTSSGDTTTTDDDKD